MVLFLEDFGLESESFIESEGSEKCSSCGDIEPDLFSEFDML